MRISLGAVLALAITLSGCASQKGVAAQSTSTTSTAGVSQNRERGVYLMQPPLHQGNPDTSAQLADWQVLAFFDHGSECDTARARGLAAYSAYVPVATGSVETSQRLAASTLCVPANDPRINWFHWTYKYPTELFE
jgi:hypothetical protein